MCVYIYKYGRYIRLFLFSLCLPIPDEYDDDVLDALEKNWFDTTEGDTEDAYSYAVNHQWTFDERKFVCPCGRTYKSKGSMTDHQRWECGKDPTFQCPYCEYCAKRKKHLRRHVVCVHKRSFVEQ